VLSKISQNQDTDFPPQRGGKFPSGRKKISVETKINFRRDGKIFPTGRKFTCDGTEIQADADSPFPASKPVGEAAPAGKNRNQNKK
jgi:hypothetical protein